MGLIRLFIGKVNKLGAIMIFRKVLLPVVFLSLIYSYSCLGGPTCLSSIKNMINDGEFASKSSLKIRCGEVYSGHGSLEAPEIEIIANKFAFGGTIKCTGKCTIITHEPFDNNLFKREGGGTFEIKVDPSVQIIEQNVSKSDDADKLMDAQLKKIDNLVNDKLPRPHFSSSHNEPASQAPNDKKDSDGEKNDAQTQQENIVAIKTFNINGTIFNASGHKTIKMMDAIQKNDLSQVQLLLPEIERSEDTKKLLSLFMFAAGLYGNFEIAQEFVRSGANVNGCGDWGQPYLLVACLEKRSDFVTFLLQSGANPNSEDWYRRTPLMKAADLGDVQNVQALLDAGALTNKKSIQGFAAVDYARMNGQQKVVEILEKAAIRTLPEDKQIFNITEENANPKDRNKVNEVLEKVSPKTFPEIKQASTVTEPARNSLAHLAAFISQNKLWPQITGACCLLAAYCTLNALIRWYK